MIEYTRAQPEPLMKSRSTQVFHRTDTERPLGSRTVEGFRMWPLMNETHVAHFKYGHGPCVCPASHRAHPQVVYLMGSSSRKASEAKERDHPGNGNAVIRGGSPGTSRKKREGGTGRDGVQYIGRKRVMVAAQPVN